MSPCRAALALAAILLGLAASGCVVPGLGGSGGKTARAAGPGADGSGGGGPEDISAFSPEVSMQRDLLQLREREAGQRETVENMRLALRQGGEDMQREEERLKDIQMQIERYDSAMRRYEMAGRYALPAGGEGGGAPARSGMAERGGYAASRGYDDGNGYGGYAAQRGEAGSPGRFPAENTGGEYGREEDLARFGGRMGEGGMATGRMREMPGAAPASPGGREEVLYAGAYDPRLAEQPAPVGDLTLRRAAGRGPVQRRPMFEDDAAEGDVFSAPDAGAFAARAPAADVWSLPQPAPAPAPARGGAEQLAAAPAGRVQPAQSVSGQRSGPGRGQLAPPAAAPETRPVVPEDDGLDEVFTPDLFLSRR